MEEQPPFKTHLTIFEQEVAQAVDELRRPATGLFLSALIAGFGMGASVLLVAILVTHAGEPIPDLLHLVLVANAYSVGFVLVIMGRTDLFTEYSTIAILPVLAGRSPLHSLGRFWGLMLFANLIGGACFAALLVGLSRSYPVIDPASFAAMARHLTDHAWHAILLSALFTGWLMGLLSWLIVAARDSMTQVIFIWIVTATLGFAGLHHAVLGFIEVMVGFFSSSEIGFFELGHFLLWATIGNMAGGGLFAVLIRYSVPLG